MPTPEKFWDKLAVKYDAKIVKGPNYANRLERINACLDDSAIILDVGCASGEITLDLAPTVKHIHGIDLSPKMIELATAKASKRNIENAHFSSVQPAHPSLAEQSFDAITAFSVFHLLEDITTTLTRLHNLLKPGGTLITETPCIGSWNPCWSLLVKLAVLTKIAPPVRIMKVTELESMITAAGFQIVESKVHNPKSRMQCIMARKPLGNEPDSSKASN